MMFGMLTVYSEKNSKPISTELNDCLSKLALKIIVTWRMDRMYRMGKYVKSKITYRINV